MSFHPTDKKTMDMTVSTLCGVKNGDALAYYSDCASFNLVARKDEAEGIDVEFICESLADALGPLHDLRVGDRIRVTLERIEQP